MPDNRIHVKIKKVSGGALVMQSSNHRLIFAEESLFPVWFAKRRCAKRGYVIDEVY